MEDNNITTIEFNEKAINVKNTLTFNEMLSMIQYMADMCFTDEGEIENVDYIPEIKDFIFGDAIVNYYTDINVLEYNTSEMYTLLYTTNLIDEIMKHVNRKQIKSISKAYDKKIEYMVSSQIEYVRNSMVALSSAVEALTNKFGLSDEIGNDEDNDNDESDDDVGNDYSNINNETSDNDNS